MATSGSTPARRVRAPPCASRCQSRLLRHLNRSTPRPPWRGRPLLMHDDQSEAIEVLLVEDDPGDVLMTREAFEQHKLRNTLHVVSDGVQAVAFLRREGEYADAPRPG